MPKVIIGVVLFLVIAFIVANPTQAASMVHGAWGHTKDIGHGLNTFVDKLVG